MNKGLKIVLIALSGVVLAAAALITVFFIRVNNPASVFPDQTPAATATANVSASPEATAQPGETATPAPATPEPTPTPIPEGVLLDMSDAEFMKGRVNVLVLGIDKSVEREASGSFRTDTMILVSINFKTMDVDMISIPRDSYVKLYGKNGQLIDPIDPFNKVNAAFSLGGSLKYGGYESAKNTVSALFGGIPVSHYVSFDMNAVKLIVDAMGGVDYDVDIEVTMDGRTLSPGMQHLDGQMVLDYCRQRKGSSDVARSDRQQRILMAIFSQMKSTGQIANLPKIYRAVEDSIVTDLSFEQICSLSLIALRMDAGQLERHMVDGAYQTVYKRSCWLVDNEKLVKLLHDVFGTTLTLDPDIDAAAVIANAAANREAVAVKLYNAALVYNDCKAFQGAYRKSISSSLYDKLSKNKSLLATAIRRECGPYLDQYTTLLNALVEQAYAEAGIPRVPLIFLPENGVLINEDGTVSEGVDQNVVIGLNGIDESEEGGGG